MTNRVRSYEASRSGTVGLGTILRYLEHLATEASAERGFDHAWYERTGSAWVVREMDIALGTPPGIDDEMVLATWLSDWKRVQARREYAIWWPHRGRVIARASARWAYVDRTRGLPIRVPEEMVSKFGVPGRPMQLTTPPADLIPQPCQPLQLVAREYEADTQQHVNNCVYGDWLEEAARLCAPPELPEGGRRRVPRYYHIEYVRPALPGAAVRVESADTTLRRALLLTQIISGESGEQLFVRAWSRHLLV